MVVDECRNPSATGRGHCGSSAPPPRPPLRPVVRGEGWMGDGEGGLFGAVDLATVVSVCR